MNISDAVSMSANGKGIQGEVQTKLLRQAQDIQANSIATLLESIKPISEGKGGVVDLIA